MRSSVLTQGLGVFLGLCLAVLIVPSLAFAGTVGVYGPGIDADTATVRARAELGSDDFTVAGSLVEFAGGADVPAIVGASAEACTKAGPNLVALLDKARNAVVEMDYLDALGHLERLTAGLPCTAANATRDQLYDLYFLQGYAHWSADQPDEALADFVVAGSIDPKREWNAAYPPAAKELFLAGLQQVFERQRVSVRVEVQPAWVDGESVGPSSRPKLIAGKHILRLQDTTFSVEVKDDEARADEDLVLTSSRRLIAGLLAGENLYAPWLADLAEQNKWGDTVLVLGGATPQVLDGRVFEGGTDPREGPSMGAVGAVLMGVGAGMAGVGLAVHMGAYDGAGVQKPSGRVVVNEAEYGPLVTQNRVGFGILVGGGAVLGAGLVTTIVGLVSESPPRATAWMTPTPDGGVAFGVGGRF